MRPINKDTTLFALLDDMANQSPRAREFNAIFTSSDINASYVPLNIRDDDILFTINGLKKSQISGVNIGAVYRRDALPILDSISDEAKECGFVNSIKIENGELYGYITVGEAIASLISGKVAIFGSGSLVKSILFHIDDISNITLVESNIENTADILQKYPDLDVKFYNLINSFNADGYDYIVDTTDGEEIALQFGDTKPELIFLDSSSSLSKFAGESSIPAKIREIQNSIDIREWL